MNYIQVEHLGNYWMIPLAESKVYVKNPSEIPKGYSTHRGSKGGYYYEPSQKDGTHLKKDIPEGTEINQIYQSLYTNPHIKSIYSTYDTLEKAKGKCHEAADKLIRYFKSLGDTNYKIHSFRVLDKNDKPVALNHVVVEMGGLYYNPTSMQFGEDKRFFTQQDIPKNYVDKGEIKPEKQFNTNKPLQKHNIWLYHWEPFSDEPNSEGTYTKMFFGSFDNRKDAKDELENAQVMQPENKYFIEFGVPPEDDEEKNKPVEGTYTKGQFPK